MVWHSQICAGVNCSNCLNRCSYFYATGSLLSPIPYCAITSSPRHRQNSKMNLTRLFTLLPMVLVLSAPLQPNSIAIRNKNSEHLDSSAIHGTNMIGDLDTTEVRLWILHAQHLPRLTLRPDFSLCKRNCCSRSESCLGRVDREKAMLLRLELGG